PPDRYPTTPLFAEAPNTPAAATGAVRRATVARARAPRPRWRRAAPAAAAAALAATGRAAPRRRHDSPAPASAGGLDPRDAAPAQRDAGAVVGTDLAPAARRCARADSLLAAAEQIDGAWIAPVVLRARVACRQSRAERDPRAIDRAFQVGLRHAERAVQMNPQ